MTEYRRNFVRGSRYFFTAALADRSQCLLVDEIPALRKAFRNVKSAYVERVADWPPSKLHLYVEAGVYHRDWAGDSEENNGGFGEV